MDKKTTGQNNNFKEEKETLQLFLNKRNKSKVNEFYSNLNPNFFELKNSIIKVNPSLNLSDENQMRLYEILTEIFKLFIQNKFEEMNERIESLNKILVAHMKAEQKEPCEKI